MNDPIYDMEQPLPVQALAEKIWWWCVIIVTIAVTLLVVCAIAEALIPGDLIPDFGSGGGRNAGGD